MKQNEQLSDIQQMALSYQLGKAIRMLENYLLAYPRQQDMDQFASLREDYRLMADYWQQGYEDPQREQVYDQLLRRVYSLTTNISLRRQLSESSFLNAIYQRPRKNRKDWTITTIRDTMESFVSDVALLEFEPEASRSEKSAELYSRHWQLMRDLFDYILTSHQWRHQLADVMLDLLLSPTLASIDQQLIVSAITLSVTQNFCFEKFRILCEVYSQTTDEPLRQRALVGWVLAAPCNVAVWSLYTEMPDFIARLCSDPRTPQELAELQMQLIYCQQADQDIATISKEILPDIMNGSKLKIKDGTIVEADEDTLDDILHPEASELAMERMEQSMQRMVDMQKQGADIYFGGFSQMKRFSFFSDISNWFVPFYPQHPGISQIWQNARAGKFLKTITRVGAFCDSDKYSFVLAFNQVLDRLPQNLIKMIEQGEASAMPVGGEVAQEEQRQPAFIRRVYLQDLYRFYRIFPARSEFVNPFQQSDSYLFFANPLFRHHSLTPHAATVGHFLMKRQRYEEAVSVLSSTLTEHRELQHWLLMGSALQNAHLTPHPSPFTPSSSPLTATECYRQALLLQPDNQQAQAGLARTLFATRDYEEALQLYQQLMILKPDHRTYQLNAAVCLLNMQRGEEAMKLLFKLSYLFPDDMAVTRIMAWAHTLLGQYQQAEKQYKQLLANEQPQPDDMLNYGYCLWLSGSIASAIDMFRQFLSCNQQPAPSLEHEFMHTEHQLLADHGITDSQIQLMLDATA